MNENDFVISEQLIPIAKLTQEFLNEYYETNANANLNGDWQDLATYTLINTLHIYRLFFEYSDVKNDIYVFATLTRSAQELLSDYLYAVNHKKSEEIVGALLDVRRFGAHLYLEYFMFVKGEIDASKLCDRPKWTESSQIDRIRKLGGDGEVAFYNLLCSYAHQSIPNHRLVEHPNEIFNLRSYFMGKVLEYLDILTNSIVDRGGLRNAKLNKAVAVYVTVKKRMAIDWNSIFPELFVFTDHDGNPTDSKGNILPHKEGSTTVFAN